MIPRRRQTRPSGLLALLVVTQCYISCTHHQECHAFSSLPPTHHHHHGAITAASSFARRRCGLRDESIRGICGRGRRRQLYSSVSDARVASASASYDLSSTSASDVLPNAWIIQWRGEGTEGYSEALRQLEFTSAFRAEMKDWMMFHNTNGDDKDGGFSLQSPQMNGYIEGIQFRFQDALTYQGPIYENGDEQNAEFDGEPIPLAQVQAYESAMQYVAISLPAELIAVDATTKLGEVFRSTVRRCSLIRTAFQIVASGDSYEELATAALGNGSFVDMMEGGTNEDATWSIRLRRYGPMELVDDAKQSKRQARYGKNVRSPLRDERKAILSMTELVQLFRGNVDLANPESRIYLLEGLKRCKLVADSTDDGTEGKRLLARVVAKGPKTSIYAPKTRICVTTTPLCPIASFTLCNIARLQRHGMPAILDPFAGSCTTLLAAAHITNLPSASSLSKASKVQSVGIEIAHNGYVNKGDIVRDFVSRSLPPPSEIIRGDCLSSEVRQQACSAIGGGAFDAIVTDPPYGIREAMSFDEEDGEAKEDMISPLSQLFYAMGHDRSNGTPLLKTGGRLVAFIPVRQGESLEDCLPDLDARKEAGLVMEGDGKEQVLSDVLSRWLVSFVCV